MSFLCAPATAAAVAPSTLPCTSMNSGISSSFLSWRRGDPPGRPDSADPMVAGRRTFPSHHLLRRVQRAGECVGHALTAVRADPVDGIGERRDARAPAGLQMLDLDAAL